MSKEELLYLIALLKVEGIGAINARTIIQFCGSPKIVFEKNAQWISQIPNIGAKTASEIANSQHLLSEAEKIVKDCERYNIEIIDYQSDIYPFSLKQIYDYPLILYAKGNIGSATWGIGIVGTREPSEYGKEQSRLLAESFCQHQITVISGLAYGIDYEAHKRVIEMQGKTIAVLANGLDVIYPSAHKKLSEEILQWNGALISEYPPKTKINPRFFPMRNRIIAGLSKAIVVVESGEKGGAMITAQYAFDQNREVWAIPGRNQDKKSLGCLKLIQKQIARVCIEPRDILLDLNLPNFYNQKPEQVTLFPDLSVAEQSIIENLLSETVHIDDLAEKTGMSMSALLSTLLTLEFKDLVVQLPGKLVKRKK